jgi:hypothetical protein
MGIWLYQLVQGYKNGVMGANRAEWEERRNLVHALITKHKAWNSCSNALKAWMEPGDMDSD